MHYMDVTAPLDIVEENLGFISMRWYTSHKLDHNVSGKELECAKVNVGECMESKAYHL